MKSVAVTRIQNLVASSGQLADLQSELDAILSWPDSRENRYEVISKILRVDLVEIQRQFIQVSEMVACIKSVEERHEVSEMIRQANLFGIPGQLSRLDQILWSALMGRNEEATGK
jgi:hypothetical protein